VLPGHKGKILTTENTEDTEEEKANEPQRNTDRKEVMSFGFWVLS
jgi:hypothetical protein